MASLLAALKRGVRRLAWWRDAPIIPATRIGGPMPWIMAIMVALVMIGAGGALVMQGMTRAASSGLASAATVQIIEADPAARTAQAQAAAAILRSDGAIAEVRVVPPGELAALLEPWLGEGALNGDLVPVPALLDVRLRGPADLATLQRLSLRLARDAPAARIDAQSAWLAPLYDAIRSVRYLAVTMALLLAAIGITAVWLAARNALASNAKTVEVVHLLGGDDRQIAGVFQRAVLPDAVAGSVVGAGLGAGTLWLLGRQFSALDAGLIAGGSLRTADWLVLLIVPLAAIGAALLTARLTVLTALRKSL
jgi:cell division transport system permease protein